MRILITGIKGQLGTELARFLSSEHQISGIDLPEDDITERGIVEHIVEAKADVVIHAAAMTNVDGCARNPDSAMVVNALGTRNVALGCQQSGADMVYISTNEVFDGTKDCPYLEFDEPHPINAYGRSKLAGEHFVQHLLNKYYIVRTSWLFGGSGNDFVRKILKLADERLELRVVTDEVSSPTYAKDLAQAIAQLIETRSYGIYHFSNFGPCSRFDWAREILALSGREHIRLLPITLKEYVRDSNPPQYSYLRNFCGEALGIALRPWQEPLREYVSQL